MDCGASAPVIGMRLARKLGIWKRARKVKVRQGDGSSLDGKFVANASFKAYNSSSVLCRFPLDAEVLDIGNRDVIFIKRSTVLPSLNSSFYATNHIHMRYSFPITVYHMSNSYTIYLHRLSILHILYSIIVGLKLTLQSLFTFQHMQLLHD